ncbi:MAG: ABC transporter ATP-binding protein [Actinomycetota bacterium]|nr:ABC transporter ATP-binding protein [Actinomycetota bacterium]
MTRADRTALVAVRFGAVDKAYGPVPALQRFSLDVEPGELLVLVGPSGSGKSTALRVLAGLEEPSAGTVHVGGRDVTTTAPHRRDVAMVFQDYALYPHLTVRDNLAFGLRVRRAPAGAVRSKVTAAAEALDLGTVLDRYPDQLSGGQQQRVALARALVREPTVYLMDEPLSNLDVTLRLAAREQVLDLHRRLGTTTLYVTHDQTEAMVMGDRVACIHEGRVLQVGEPQQVYDEPASILVAGLLGSPPMNVVGGDRPTGRLLGGGGGGGALVGVRPEDLRLDPTGSIEATVRSVELLGSETVLHVRCPDGEGLAVRTPPRDSSRPGETVRMSAAPGRSHHFDAGSGRRLP